MLSGVAVGVHAFAARSLQERKRSADLAIGLVRVCARARTGSNPLAEDGGPKLKRIREKFFQLERETLGPAATLPARGHAEPEATTVREEPSVGSR
jgi:hypothetical protein